MLIGYEDGGFVYEDRFLKGCVFEVTAAEDIATQDNQGTNWYDKGELVTTITTGKGAEFTRECKGITEFTVDEDGTVTVDLPLGKYHVTEKETGYGYVLPEQVFVVGRTYVLTEKRPADGYATADSIEFTVEDTGEIQSVAMKDETTAGGRKPCGWGIVEDHKRV